MCINAMVTLFIGLSSPDTLSFFGKLLLFLRPGRMFIVNDEIMLMGLFVVCFRVFVAVNLSVHFMLRTPDKYGGDQRQCCHNSQGDE